MVAVAAPNAAAEVQLEADLRILFDRGTARTLWHRARSMPNLTGSLVLLPMITAILVKVRVVARRLQFLCRSRVPLRNAFAKRKQGVVRSVTDVPPGGYGRRRPGHSGDWRFPLVLLLGLGAAAGRDWWREHLQLAQESNENPPQRVGQLAHCASARDRVVDPATHEFPRDYSINCPHSQRWMHSPPAQGSVTNMRRAFDLTR